MLENRDCTPHLTAGILAVKEEMGIWTGLYADLDSRKQPCVLERHNSHTIKKQISFKPFFICMYADVCIFMCVQGTHALVYRIQRTALGAILQLFPPTLDTVSLTEPSALSSRPGY